MKRERTEARVRKEEREKADTRLKGERAKTVLDMSLFLYNLMKKFLQLYRKSKQNGNLDSK